jgi:hypothetical protein
MIAAFLMESSPHDIAGRDGDLFIDPGPKKTIPIRMLAQIT